jgi:hypothetical protein
MMLPILVAGLAVTASLIGAERAEARKTLPLFCPTQGELPTGNENTELFVVGDCIVPAGTHVYGNVHIFEYEPSPGVKTQGKLIFSDATIDFWAKSILVEKNGSLIAGVPTPIGTANPKNVVTIHLYGADQTCVDARGNFDPSCANPKQGKGILCVTDHERCGVPLPFWSSNAVRDSMGHFSPGNPATAVKIKDVTGSPEPYAGPVTDDYFYPYHGLLFDMAAHGSEDRSEHVTSMGYFGYKVLGVSYGGTVQLFGKKGSCTANCDLPSTTAPSWVRLARTVNPSVATPDPKELLLSSPVDWSPDDKIVLTTTDYLPGHSELLTVRSSSNNGTTITVDETPQYIHNGQRYPLPQYGDNDQSDEAKRFRKLGLNADLVTNGAETRAAVALLNRNIRIVSGGDGPTDFPTEAQCKATPSPKCYFGGHMVVRQGFKLVQIQGVEFKLMGQGGRLGHYPIHFHHARKTKDTFIKDSSINESMTRWIVLHGTQDVLLQRNVGYKSIGHGFYLEDGTEINNKLYANLGIFARAAVDNKQNPRKVPGILAAPDLDAVPALEKFPFKSDYDHPAVFWITNGWNDFQYNMAAGAGTCGACYWFVPAANSTISRVVNGKGPRWESYASLQVKEMGITPLMNFVGNYCSTAMTSFQTVGATEPCLGVIDVNLDTGAFLSPVHNPLAPKWNDPTYVDASGLPDPHHLDYYPTVDEGGNRAPTRCGGFSHAADADCKDLPKCSAGNPQNCMLTVIDRYTTSFNFAPLNFAAIWLRPQWYLLTDSVITDVQQAGVTMVTGGGYSSSDVIPGHWALTRRSVFIGHTQENNPLASDGGPFNPQSGDIKCATISKDGNRPGNRCVNVDEGVAFQISNFGMYQRLMSFYDGPAYQDSNLYLNIKHRRFDDDCKPFTDLPNKSGFCDPLVKPPTAGGHIDSVWLAGIVQGLPKGKDKDGTEYCYMPNAAIGWKQPNGFYYPPAFHSTNLVFKDVDTRHFVITPLFREGTLEPDYERIAKAYCKWDRNVFKDFTSIDRQTVLNDDDGSLTGYTGPGRPSIVINLDEFFTEPVEAIQCLSQASSKTSPYEWVSTIVYPACAITGKCAIPATDSAGNAIPNPHTGDWDRACTSPNCYGLPLRRQDLTKGDGGDPKTIRMMGQSTGQRSSLTVNRGTYYLDTTASRDKQLKNTRLNTNTGLFEECAVPSPADKECNINVFQPGDTYYLFLIYAKEDTEQTYQFYVGPGTKSDPREDVVLKLVKANIGPNPIDFVSGGDFDLPAGRAKWVNNDPSKGIVEVTLKATDLPGFATNLAAAREKDCQPKTFCAWESSTNSCKRCTSFNTDTSSTDFGKCLTFDGDEICRWASIDPHCPEGGCLGLKFTLPSGKFSTDKAIAPPAAKPLTCYVDTAKTTPSPFKVDFTKLGDGTCPMEGPSFAPTNKTDDRAELAFTDVVATKGSGDCFNQPYTADWPFPHCQCKP